MEIPVWLWESAILVMGSTQATIMVATALIMVTPSSLEAVTAIVVTTAATTSTVAATTDIPVGGLVVTVAVVSVGVVSVGAASTAGEHTVSVVAVTVVVTGNVLSHPNSLKTGPRIHGWRGLRFVMIDRPG